MTVKELIVALVLADELDLAMEVVVDDDGFPIESVQVNPDSGIVHLITGDI